MAQIDRVIYFPMLVWFIFLFIIFYAVLYFTFLPVIYKTLKGRSLYFMDLILSIKRINKGFKFFGLFFKKYGLFNFLNIICYLLKNINKIILFNSINFFKINN